MISIRILISIFLAALLLAGLWATTRRKPFSPSYRLFLMIFFALWSFVLWIRPYRPSAMLLVFSLVMVVFLFALPRISARPPDGRRETKAMLERLQQEKRIDRFFRSPGGLFYCVLLGSLIGSVCFRILSIYGVG